MCIRDRHLGGRACPGNTDLKGAWFGFTWTHKREHFYRALLESIAYDQYLQYRNFQSISPGLQVAEVTAYGGGAKSALWNQIKANVLGLPHVLLGREDLAPIGNAILAGYALGIYADMAETAERFVRRTSRVDPQLDAHDYYVECAGFYEQLLRQTEPAFARLTALPEP